LKLLFAASEVAPFAKTGGLADVVGSLPRALAHRGHTCAVLLPLYRCARHAAEPVEPTDLHFEVLVGPQRVPARLWRSHLPQSDVAVYLVEQPDYFDRDDPALGKGLYQYRLPSGKLADYPDNFQRFVFFSQAVLEVIPLVGFWPDVLHVHDWQTGLVPVYLRERYARRPGYSGIRTLFTIHNIAFQGVFWHWDMLLTGLDWGLFNWRQLEFYGHLNLLKAGIVFADAVNTVSPWYAREIQTPAYGCGLDGILRHYQDKLVGIMNGVDYEAWDPAGDPHLPARYTADTVRTGKAACKAALQQRLHLPERPEVPLLGMVSRLTDQKGLDLFILPEDFPPPVKHEAVRRLAEQKGLDALARDGAIGRLLANEDVQLAVLGTGEPLYHRFLTELLRAHPGRVAVTFAFDEPLAHLIEAGADLFLMPSRFEPSGLNQLYSLKYGTVPVVRRTGGLADSVTDCTPETLAAGTATGFVFEPFTPAAFLAAVRRALTTYRTQPDVWLQLQRTGMSQDWSWEHSAQQYEDVYRRLVGKR
jgi:starch synthase